MLWKVPQCLSKTWTRSEEVLNFLPSKVRSRSGRNAPSAKTGQADDVSYFFLAFSPLSLQPWSTNSSAMWLWTSATGIIKLTRNWPALASGSTLGDGDSIKPALAAASASTAMRRGVGLWSHMRALLSVESSACRNQKGNKP